MGVLIAPIFVYSQVTIECLIDEEITAPWCYDCTNSSDTALFTGFRIIHSGVDTTMIEAPWRLKVRRSTDEFIFFDYRDEVKFSHIDSVGAFSTLDDLIQYVKDCQSFTVIYGNGDSTNTMHWQDTMYINYPEGGGGGGPGDTSYVWWYEVDGNTPARDTVVSGEGINFVAGTNMDIDQAATNLTFNNTMSDTACVYALEQLTDSTARLVDCHGVNRGEVEFIGTVPAPVDSDSCRQSFIFLNDTTLLLSGCDGVTGKDTAIFRGGGGNDTYLDSSFYAQDTITFYRFDSDGVVDSFKMELIINDSIVPDTQSLAIANDSLYISRGNGVDLSPYLDNDTIYQQLSKSNDTIYLENGGFVLDYNDTIYQNIIKDGVAVTLSIVNDTIADLEERGVVYWKNGDWATDSAYIQYNDTWKQLLINRGDTNAISAYRLAMKGSAYLQNDPNYGPQTKVTFQDETGDEWNIVNTERKFIIQTPNSGDGDGALSIDSNTISRAIQVFQEGTGLYIGANEPDFPLDVHGDIHSDAYFVDWQQSTGLGDDWIMSRDGVGSRYKPIVGRDGITISAQYDSIFVEGTGEGSFSNGTPWHIPFFDGDSTIRTVSAWDSLVLMNDSQRWIYFNDPLSSLAIGKGAQARNNLNTSLGAYAFPFSAYASGETVSNSQVDTTNEVFTGLTSFITTLTDSGYVVGQNVTINVQLNSGEMPFIDSAVHMPTGLIVFEIASTSTLRPVYFELDSAATGSYEFTANKYLDHSTAIGALSVVTKPHQMALGDSSLAELKIGDSIWIKADTFYQNQDVMIFDSDLAQIIPIGLDSLNALLNIEASGPQEIDTMYTSNDTLFLKLEHTDQKFAVLPQGLDTTYVSGDSLYINDQYVLLPQGADSLGIALPTGQVIHSNGTRGPGGSDSLFFTGDMLGIGTASPAANLHVLDAANAYIRLDKGSGNYTELREIATQLRINNYSASGNSGIDINPVVSDGSGASFFRFFREVNTTGPAYFDIHLGDGSSTINARIAGKGTNSFMAGNNGNFGVGTTNPLQKMHVSGTVRLDNLGTIGTTTGVLVHDADNDVGQRTLSDFASDISGSLGVAWERDGSDDTYLTNINDFVGIGIADAVRKLHIKRDAASNVGLIRLENATVGGDAAIEFGANGTYGAIGMDNGGDLIISHHDNLDASRAIYVNALGRVGILTTPDVGMEFHVAGDARVTGGFYDSSGDVGSSGQVLSSTGSATNWVSLVDNSTTNELQGFTFTGSTATTWEAVLSDGGGTLQITEGSGIDITPSGGTVTIATTSPPYAGWDLNANSGTNTHIGDEEEVNFEAAGTGLSVARSGNTITYTSSGGSADGNGIYSNDNTISGTTRNVTLPTSALNFLDNGSGSNILNLNSSGSGGMTVNVNPYIGASGADQLYINSFSTAVQIGHEDGNGYLQFVDDGEIFLSANNSQVLNLYGSGGLSLGVGTGSVYVEGGVTGTYTFEVNGSAAKTAPGTAWIAVSDRRLKDRIEPIKDPYEKIMKLNPVGFHYNKEYRERYNQEDRQNYGWIAQDYQKVFPEDVSTQDDGYLALAPDGVTPHNTAAIQQLIRDNQALQARIEKLEKLIK